MRGRTASLVVGNFGTLPADGRKSGSVLGDVQMLPASRRLHVNAQSHRLAWCAEADDVLLVPYPPRQAFLDYLADLLGFGRPSPVVLSPAPGEPGESWRAKVRAILVGRGVDAILPFHFDEAVIRLARALELDGATPGFAYFEQGGATLLNSKVAFRAMAMGMGLPVPDGTSTISATVAEEFIWRLLASGRCAILKQDFEVGGRGNEIVSPSLGIDARGAHSVVVLPSRDAVRRYLEERWSWCTCSGCHRVVIEEYVPESVPVYVGFHVGDDGIEPYGHGHMTMAPVIAGLVIPAPAAALPAFDGFLNDARRLAELARRMGYRGRLSVDGMLTPSGDIQLNECNARLGGATHVHELAAKVVGGLDDRVILDRRPCGFARLEAAVRALADRGVLYDRRERRGVVITVDDAAAEGHSGEYCVVAENLDEAGRIDAELAHVLVRDEHGA